MVCGFRLSFWVRLVLVVSLSVVVSCVDGCLSVSLILLTWVAVSGSLSFSLNALELHIGLQAWDSYLYLFGWLIFFYGVLLSFWRIYLSILLCKKLIASSRLCTVSIR